MFKIITAITTTALIVTLGSGCANLRPVRPQAPTDMELEAEASLLILSNDVAVVGIMPRLAGRVVLYRLCEGRNVLKSDPNNWALPTEEYPSPTPQSSTMPFFGGHITWVGPQAEWWTQQDVNIQRKEAAADWPPDPYLLFSEYGVTIHSNNYVKLVGPISPVSGLQLTKETALLPDGRVRHRVIAENMRTNSVSWNLWSNTRLPGSSRFYLSVSDKKSRIRTKNVTARPLSIRPLSSIIVNGFFTFRNETEADEDISHRTGRALVSPYDCAVAVFDDDRVFIKRLLQIHRQLIHPDQEIFDLFQDTREDGTLELGANGPYVTIPPGGKLALSEMWTIYFYDGPNTAESETEFLKELNTIELPVR